VRVARSKLCSLIPYPVPPCSAGILAANCSGVDAGSSMLRKCRPAKKPKQIKDNKYMMHLLRWMSNKMYYLIGRWNANYLRLRLKPEIINIKVRIKIILLVQKH